MSFLTFLLTPFLYLSYSQLFKKNESSKNPEHGSL